MIFSSHSIKKTPTATIKVVISSLTQDRSDLLHQIEHPSDDSVINSQGYYRFSIRVYPRSIDTLRETKIIALRTLLNSVEREINTYKK